MNLQNRFLLLESLRTYLLQNPTDWQECCNRATAANAWFTPEFIRQAVQNITGQFLEPKLLQNWVASYSIPETNAQPQTIGLVMAGNIPMVGFHDFLCIFISGHRQRIKCSSKDDVLLKHLVQIMAAQNPEINNWVVFAEQLKGCDAYIATGSNNSATHFEYYFGKYPNIIRKNRTSVAVLNGNESANELELLADDIHMYFGLGCRNVTKLFVPEGYDFVPLLDACRKYAYFRDHDKYKNNLDYYLTIQIMNNQFYMTNDSLILIKADSVFSPISQLHYEFYTDQKTLVESLASNSDIQCIVGTNIPFGSAQQPALQQYADGLDTLQFLTNLPHLRNPS